MPEPALHAFVSASDGVIYVVVALRRLARRQLFGYIRRAASRWWGRLTPMPEVRYYGSDAAIIDGCSTCSAVGTIAGCWAVAARRRVLF